MTSPTGLKLGNDVERMVPWVRDVVYYLAQKFGITDVGGVRSDPIFGHPQGVAGDFMTRNGDALAEYAVANHLELGINQVIWNRRIWTLERASEGWRPYTGTSNPHVDHVHIKWKSGSKPAGVTLLGLKDGIGTVGAKLFDLDGFMQKAEGTSVTLLAAGFGVALIGVGVVVSVRSSAGRAIAKKVSG